MSRRGVDEEMPDIRMGTSGAVRMHLGPLPTYRQPSVEANPSTPLPLTPVPLDQLRSVRYADVRHPSSCTDSLSTHSSSSSSSSSGLVPPQIVGAKRGRALVDDGDTLSTSSSDDAGRASGDGNIGHSGGDGWGAGVTADRGLKARISEGSWEEMDDFVLQSFLLHPLQPLTHPYPPGTLPDPPALDELTNQIMHYESLEHSSPRSKARAHSARLRERSSSSRIKSHTARSSASDYNSESTVADEDEDMASKGKRRWMHTWKQTRARLAHLARLISKGYNTEEIARALGHLSNESVDERTVSGDDGIVNAAAKSSNATTEIGPFKVGGTGPTARSRPARPHIRRISSMDFLDALAVTSEVAEVQEGESTDIGSPDRPKRTDADLGRVLRLSTTLQNSSKDDNMTTPCPSLLPLGSPLDVSNTALLSPPDAVDPSVTRSPAIPNPRRSLRRRPSTKMSSSGLARPTSLLQRGRSFTASDLTKEVEEMRETMAAARKAEDVLMECVIEAGQPSKLTYMDSPANPYVTPVKKQPTGVGIRGPPATDSTPSDSNSPLSGSSPLFSSPMDSAPTSTIISPSPPKPPASSSTSFRFSAAQRPKRANSSITSAEYEHAPHELQQLFIAPVQPSTKDRSQLLAPLDLGFALGQGSPDNNTSPKILLHMEEDEDEDMLVVRRKRGRTSGLVERDSARPRTKFGGVLGGAKPEAGATS